MSSLRGVVTVISMASVLGFAGMSPAHAMFVIDVNPAGTALSLNNVSDVGPTFTGTVFTPNDISITTNVNVDTASGVATIKPTSSNELLTTITFTPLNPNLFDGFSSRGQFLVAPGTLTFTVQDNQGDAPQTFNFNVSAANADIGPFGIIAKAGSGETIKSISIFDSDGFIQAQQFTFDGVEIAPAVPETSTWAMMIMGFMGVGFLAYRRKPNGPSLRIA